MDRCVFCWNLSRTYQYHSWREISHPCKSRLWAVCFWRHLSGSSLAIGTFPSMPKRIAVLSERLEKAVHFEIHTNGARRFLGMNPHVDTERERCSPILSVTFCPLSYSHRSRWKTFSSLLHPKTGSLRVSSSRSKGFPWNRRFWESGEKGGPFNRFAAGS